MTIKITKKVDIDLDGIDGNAFMIIGAWSKQARREGWTPEEIKQVQDEATAGDYDDLLQVIMQYTK